MRESRLTLRKRASRSRRIAVALATLLSVGVVTPVLGAAIVPGVASADTLVYRPTDIGTLGGTWSETIAVNDAGLVVGNSALVGDNPVQAFAWTATGGPMVGLGTLGGSQSNATAVSSSGQVVGTSLMAGDAEAHAFSWTAAGGMVDLGTLGGTRSDATAVSDAGQVVGYSSTAGDAEYHAFSWTAAGNPQMVDLGTLGGPFSDALGVNGSGLVIGYGSTSGGQNHAFAGTAGGGPLVDLGTYAGAQDSNASAVNAAGQVVGTGYRVSDRAYHAFSWTQAGGMIGLGDVGGGAAPRAISDSGQVVGLRYLQPNLGTYQAFSWTQAAGLVDLGALGTEPTSSSAAGVNGSGLVVGKSWYSNSPSSNGWAYHGFAWTHDAGMVDLGTLGGSNCDECGWATTSEAVGVNASGLIAGNAYTLHGNEHAVLWQFGSLTEPTDQVPPTITIGSSTDGAFYAPGTLASATYSCTDEAGGSGLASCNGTVLNGSNIDTSTPGANTFSVTATDGAGNDRTKSTTYHVVAPVDVTGSVDAGETFMTDPTDTMPTADVPLKTYVTSANAGGIEIAQGGVTQPTPAGYALLGFQTNISAPLGSAARPLTLRFRFYQGLLDAAGMSVRDMVVFRDGVPVAECANPAAVTPAPEPCVFARRTPGNDPVAEIDVYTAHASAWNFGNRLPSADATPPAVTLTTPVDGAAYAQGAAVAVSFSCVDEVDGSGLASCTGPVVDGASLDTSASAVGAHTFSVTGTDNAGNASTTNVTYHVVAPVSISGAVGAGGSFGTGTSPSPDAPLQTGLTSPNAGPVAIAQGGVTQPAPVGYDLLGFEASVTAPAATVGSPLTLRFSLDAGLLMAAGLDVSQVVVLRDGAPIGMCANPAVVIAAPDPCVFARTTLGDGSAEIDVYSSHASRWDFGRRLTTPPPLLISTASLPNGTVGVGYSRALSATGGAPPIAWAIASGALPSGLALDPSTGSITGTPRAPGTAHFSVRATDTSLPAGQSVTTALSITIAATANPASATVGVPYWANVASFGGVAPYSWSRTGGTLPPGLTLNSTTGSISGTPTTEGKFSFTVQVADSKKPKPTKVSKDFKIAVAPIAISIAPSTLSSASKGVKYSVTLSAAGGIPGYSFKLTAGALPAGLSLGSGGVLSGKPTTRRSYTFTITATDKFGFTGTRSYTVLVT